MQSEARDMMLQSNHLAETMYKSEMTTQQSEIQFNNHTACRMKELPCLLDVHRSSLNRDIEKPMHFAPHWHRELHALLEHN